MRRYDEFDENAEDPSPRRRAMLNRLQGPDPDAVSAALPAPPDDMPSSAVPNAQSSPALSPPSTGDAYTPPNPPPYLPGPGFNGGQEPPTAPITTEPVARTTGVPNASPNPYAVDENGIPTLAPPGQHWDNVIMAFVPNNIPRDPNSQYRFDAAANQLVGVTNPAARIGVPTTRPTGGRLTDPNFAAQFVAWAGTLPGVNPSVRNDPNYWIGRFTSGAFQNDQDYALQRMLQPEGAPEGAPVSPGTAAFPSTRGTTSRVSDLGGYTFNPQSGYQFGYSGGQGDGSRGLPPELAAFYGAQTRAVEAQRAQQEQIQTTMRDALLRLLAQGQQPVDVANDQTLGPAAAQFRLASRREQARNREALAERYAAQGLNPGGQGSGAFESAVERGNQDTGNAIAGYEAQLAQNELQNRRGLLVQALQIAQALGARTEANDLQQELAQLDAALRQQQLQFNYAQLGQQQGQYEDTLGFNYANLLSNLNRQNYLSLLE